MFHTLGADTWVLEYSVVLLLVHGRLADEKKKHKKAAHLGSTLRDTSILAGTQLLSKIHWNTGIHADHEQHSDCSPVSCKVAQMQWGL